MTTSEDFDAVVERYHQAAGEFVKGNNETYKALFSQGEDVTVANPFFPAIRGWKNVEDRMDRAAARWSEGEVIGFENIVKYVSDDLGYILENERFHAKIGGSQEAGPIALRVTSILRRLHAKQHFCFRVESENGALLEFAQCDSERQYHLRPGSNRFQAVAGFSSSLPLSRDRDSGAVILWWEHSAGSVPAVSTFGPVAAPFGPSSKESRRRSIPAVDRNLRTRGIAERVTP